MKKSNNGRRLYRVTGKWPTLAVCLACSFVIILFARVAGHAIKTSATPTKRPIYSVETTERLVSLGINCAWDDTDIPQLLEILGHYNVKASFFIVGDWCDQYPESVKQIYEAGHEIGSHSDTHADMTKLNREQLIREVCNSAQKIQAVTGEKPVLFRPPSGAYNNLAIEVIEQEGFFPIQWDCEGVHIKTRNA